MKDACEKKTGVDSCKTTVIPPVIDIHPNKSFSLKNMKIPTFIYPATPLIYKNHQVIIEACKQLLIDNVTNFQVIFTLTGKENYLSQDLIKQVIRYRLPILFIGKQDRVTMFDWYTGTILLFPSYIETFGLPLLEARLHNTPILAAETAFAREILANYSNVHFFQYDNALQLKITMHKFITVFQGN